MLQFAPTVSAAIESRATMALEVNITKVIVELVLAVVFLLLLFIFRKRFLKILSACSFVVCLFLACIAFFGEHSLITWIMRWITAAAACVLTVAVVNRINWKQKKR